MNSFEKWKPLRKLNKEFMSRIKLFCIFGQNSNEVLLVTKMFDEVFAFGDNSNGCLGLGTDKSIDEPLKIMQLCNKSICKFAYGLSHVIALTNNGQIYSWGNNNFGQLGDGTNTNRNKPKLIESLIDEKVIEISCGAHFTLALTEHRDVYAFGHNCFGQLGCNSTYDQLIPIKVTGFESEKVKSVSCGFEHSTALTESGCVFVWGANDMGQLAIHNREDQYLPIRVKHLDSVIIKKIVCGSAHNLLLSSDHNIYAFGYNIKGQIGSGDYDNKYFPITVNEDEQFADIAAVFLNDLSVAVTLSGNYFIWGQTESMTEHIPKPKRIDSKSVNDIFAEFAFIKVNYKQIL